MKGCLKNSVVQFPFSPPPLPFYMNKWLCLLQKVAIFVLEQLDKEPAGKALYKKTQLKAVKYDLEHQL